jgi:hypothetical protein
MLTSDLAEEILGTLHAGTFSATRAIVSGDPSRGVKTSRMLKVELAFPSPKRAKLFDAAQALFPSTNNQGPHLISYSMRGIGNSTEGDLKVNVYFPLPYASAERFGENARSRFIERMAAYITDQAIRGQMATNGYTTTIPLYEDPRHEDEKKIIRFKEGAAAFFKRFIPSRKKPDQRRFDEYL